MRNRGKTSRGFTLVEIMIVVLIIAIITAISVPQFVNDRTLSQASTCMANLKQIETAKETWALQTSQPVTATPLQTDLVPAFMKSFPSCPSSGTYTIGTLSVRPTCTIAGHVIGS